MDTDKPKTESFREQVLFRLEQELARHGRPSAPMTEQPARETEPVAAPVAPPASILAIKAEQQDKPAAEVKIKPHYTGHRERLRQRFSDHGEAAFADYELLELLLFRSVPRADTKPLAKALLGRFGSFADVLGADIHHLQEVSGCGPAVATDLKIIAAAAIRMAKGKLHKRTVFASWEEILAYCKLVMTHETREQFRILFLDKKNQLIKDEIVQHGTIDHIPVYPREVINRANQLGAAALILVHNHPSGDPNPSNQDIVMTMKLKAIGKELDIIIQDHIIIGRDRYYSFRHENLL
ncbi:MAG: DNA repair protein RadC [Candidatus Tokpelaia hoelldobleri]|uniref:DNA repair protein RadC n=1 Tax=Candidatus Tokpelaia hoelldobleri TaxID=1902579 RepID=A0A1U9JV30_9HYPH|nr:MAG: DNA repair protein RadC [Candidatus Tokpelaia hoelldoblerii]